MVTSAIRNIQAIVLISGLTLGLSGCDVRRVSTGDGGTGADGGAEPDSTPGRDSASPCALPQGTCRGDGDCGAGQTCVVRADASQCVFDPCPERRASANNNDDGAHRAALVPMPCLGHCEARGCRNNSDCGAGAFCDVSGDCAYPGSCRAWPAGCGADEAPEPGNGFAPVPADAGSEKRAPDSGAADPMPPPPPGPVCGCDGATYVSEGAANCAGASVARYGACESSGCDDDTDCPAGSYCAIEGACQVTGGKQGSCATMPTGCPFLATPDWHCGCNGISYPSACDAARKGINVAHVGQCGPAPLTCGVIDDCCDCLAEPQATGLVPPPTCPATCDKTRCQALGLHKAVGYLAGGTCLLADAATKCASDVECYKINDCCLCAALPVTAGPDEPYPCEQSCPLGLCTTLGLGPLKPRCISGRCELAP